MLIRDSSFVQKSLGSLLTGPTPPPTFKPTAAPTLPPTKKPTGAPTGPPTNSPTASPTNKACQINVLVTGATPGGLQRPSLGSYSPVKGLKQKGRQVYVYAKNFLFYTPKIHGWVISPGLNKLGTIYMYVKDDAVDPSTIKAVWHVASTTKFIAAKLVKTSCVAGQ